MFRPLRLNIHVSFFTILVFLFGCFSILEALKYQFAGFTVYIGDIFYYLFLIYGLIYILNPKNRSYSNFDKKNKQINYIFLFLLIFSTNFWTPLIDFGLEGSLDGYTGALKYALKTVILCFLILCISRFDNRHKIQFIRYYIYGFLTAIIIHAVYSLYQMIQWYVFGLDIHTQILNDMGITEDTVGHVLINFLYPPVIRLSGIHWDPAYFGLWGCIGIFSLYYMRKNKFIKYICLPIVIITWILSFSRTGYFSFIVLLFIFFVCHRYNSSLPWIRVKSILEISFLILVFVLIIYFSLPEEYTILLNDAISYRFDISDVSSDAGSHRHLNYPLYALEGSLHDPVHFLFGYGARNSSRGILASGNITDFVSTEVFDIESDFCKMLLNYGFIYFVLYCYFNYILVVNYIKVFNFKKEIISYIIFITVISTFFAGIFYVYNDSKWVWIIYYIAVLDLTGKTSKAI